MILPDYVADEIKEKARQLVDIASDIAMDLADGENPGPFLSICIQAVAGAMIDRAFYVVQDAAEMLREPMLIHRLIGIETALETIAAERQAAHDERNEARAARKSATVSAATRAHKPKLSKGTT